MPNFSIRAGTMDELYNPEGHWVFVDMGFSEKNKTCGFLELPAGDKDRKEAVTLTFGELKDEVVKLAKKKGPPLHLVLEAPLSAAFDDKGNPLGRREIEKRGSETRYWYVGLGCSVLVASLYLLKEVMNADRAREVRLFEGMVSFKKDEKTSHEEDVLALKKAVWSGNRKKFIEADGMEGIHSIACTLALLGLADVLPPPIILVE